LQRGMDFKVWYHFLQLKICTYPHIYSQDTHFTVACIRTHTLLAAPPAFTHTFTYTPLHTHVIGSPASLHTHIHVHVLTHIHTQHTSIYSHTYTHMLLHVRPLRACMHKWRTKKHRTQGRSCIGRLKSAGTQALTCSRCACVCMCVRVYVCMCNCVCECVLVWVSEGGFG